MACNEADVITSAELSDLKKDIQTIDDVVELTADTTTTKTGATINTLRGQLKLLGYEVPVTYAGGIVFGVDDNTKTVDESGVVYAPYPSALPFTTSGTWTADDEDKFFVAQGLTTGSSEVVLAADTVADMKTKDLQSGQIIRTKVNNTTSNAGGALYLIQTAAEYGGTPDGFGDHVLDNGNVAVLQIKNSTLHVSQFGVVGDGVANDSPALSALGSAISDGFTVEFDGTGNYLLNSRVDFPEVNDLVLEFNGAQISMPASPDYASSTNMGISAINFGATTYSFEGFKDNYDTIPTTRNITVKGLRFEGVFTGDPLTDDLFEISNYSNSNRVLSFSKVANYTVVDCSFKNCASTAIDSWATLGKNKITNNEFENIRTQAIGSSRNTFAGGGTPSQDFVARDEMEVSYNRVDKIGSLFADYHQKNTSQYAGMWMHHNTILNCTGLIYKNQVFLDEDKSDYLIFEDNYIKVNPNLDANTIGLGVTVWVDDVASERVYIRRNIGLDMKFGIAKIRCAYTKIIEFTHNDVDITNTSVVSGVFLLADTTAPGGVIGVIDSLKYEHNKVSAVNCSGICASSYGSTGEIVDFRFVGNKINCGTLATPYSGVNAKKAHHVTYNDNVIKVTTANTTNFSFFLESAGISKSIQFNNNYMDLFDGTNGQLLLQAELVTFTGNQVLNAYSILGALEGVVQGSVDEVVANNINVA